MRKILLYSQDKEQISAVLEATQEMKVSSEVLVLDNALDFLYTASSLRNDSIALINVDHPECEELKPVKLLKKLNSGIPMVFFSESGKYAIEAFEEGVSDYVRAPFSSEKIVRAIGKAKEDMEKNIEESPYIRTFSSFEVVQGGRPIPWKNSKTKELLALLVDNRGTPISSDFIQETLWPDADPGKTATRYHTTLHHLREKLKRHGIEDLIEVSRGSLRIDPDKISCDLFEFEEALEEGTKEAYKRAFDLYRGGYLEKNTYPWSLFSRIRIQLQFEQIWKYL